MSVVAAMECNYHYILELKMFFPTEWKKEND